MSKNRTMLTVGLLLLLLPMPVLAANESRELLRPGMGSEWLGSQDADTQGVVDYLLGALIVVTALAFIYYQVRGGITVMKESTEMGDPEKKASAGTGVLMVLVALVVIVLIYRVGMNFFKWY